MWVQLMLLSCEKKGGMKVLIKAQESWKTDERGQTFKGSAVPSRRALEQKIWCGFLLDLELNPRRGGLFDLAGGLNHWSDLIVLGAGE